MYIVATLRCNVAEGRFLAFFFSLRNHDPDCSVAKHNAERGREFVKIIGGHLFFQSKYRNGWGDFPQKSDEITRQMVARLFLICTFVS